MPIQIKAPDGSIAQFPDGMADADIEKVMAAHYPQPSTLDRIVASPVGRAIHDIGVNSLSGMANLAGKAADMAPFSLGLAGPLISQATQGVDQPYQGALARNRNTPGYAAARTEANNLQRARGGSGIDDAMLAPFLPTIAGATGLMGGLDTSNAMADAQEQGQSDYAQKNPLLAAGAGVAGGMLLAPRMGKLPEPIPKQSIPTVADLKGDARALYKQVDDSGVRVSTDALNDMADRLQDRMGSRLDPTLHPDATAAYNRVMKYATDAPAVPGPATFAELDNLRKVIGDAAQSPKPADAALAGQIRDHLDNFVDNLSSEHLDTSGVDAARADLTSATGAKGQLAKQIKSIEQNKPGALAARGAAGAGTREAYMDMQGQFPRLESQRLAAMDNFKAESGLVEAGPQDAIAALTKARDLWSRAKQVETIQEVLDRADIKASGYSQSGEENAVRAGFRQLALNNKKMARLSPEVQQAVIAVAKGGPLTNTLRNIGKYAPHGPVAAASGAALGSGAGALLGGMAGAAGGGGVGAAMLPLVGEMARAGATTRTLAAAQRAMDTAALGRSGLPAVPQGPLQLPRLPNNRGLPYGPLLLQLPQRSTSNR